MGIAFCLRGSVIPPARIPRVPTMSWTSEIIEPPRTSCGYRYADRRGSIIPPALTVWVSKQARLVRLLNPPGKHALTCTRRGLCQRGSIIPPADWGWVSDCSRLVRLLNPPETNVGIVGPLGGAHNPTRWRNRCGSRVFIGQRVRDCQAASRTSPVSSARSAFAAIQRSFKISFLTTRSDAACRRPSLHSGRSAS